MELAEELQTLAPFGRANPTVSLLVRDARFRDRRPMGEGRHVRFTVHRRPPVARSRAVAFGAGTRLPVARRRAGGRDLHAGGQRVERRQRAPPGAAPRPTGRHGCPTGRGSRRCPPQVDARPRREPHELGAVRLTLPIPRRVHRPGSRHGGFPMSVPLPCSHGAPTGSAAQRARAPAARGSVRDRLRARGRLGSRDRPRAGGGGVRVRLRAPRRAAAQVGRGLHRAPGWRGAHLRGHAPGHRDALRGAAARHGRGHLGLDRGGARALRRGDRERRGRRHEADRASPSSRATRRRRRTTAR